ncbi:hypothetical protein EBZ37_06470 [bacterium]|nr:hypothetical protein [bacterium]
MKHALQARFELVLVDEFQDTNPTQAQVIWSMVRADQSNLCVVGDPKQSIYRFRDADVSLFEESCERLPVRKSLTTNFRSHPRILEAVNQICAPLFEASSLYYEPLAPGRGAAEFGLAENEPPVFRLNVESPEGLADWVSAEQSRGVPLESMAILMRRVRGMEAWIQALSRRGIPVAVGGGGLFWQDPRVLELLSLLTWWVFPVDEWAALGFLTAPWMQIPTAQLDGWKKKQGNFEAFWLSDHPISNALRPLRGRAVRPGEILSSLLEDPQLETYLSELSQSLLALWYRCEQLSIQGADSHEVVRRLNETIRNGKREKEVPPPNNRGVLPILTVHASKGLEFEYVFLIDFGKKQSLGSSPLLFADRHRGIFLTPRTPDGKRNDRDQSYKEWKSFEQAAAVAESKRQFYVALTRARKRLVFVCSPIDPEKGFLADPDAALNVDHWRGWLEHLGKGIPAIEPPIQNAGASQFSRSEPSKRQARRSGSMEQSQIPVQGWARARHSVSDWTVLGRCERSYAQRLLDHSGSLSVEPDEQIKEQRAEYQDEPLTVRADEFGKRVHSLLEKWLVRDRGVVTEQFRDEIEALHQQAGAAHFHPEQLIDWLATSGRLGERAYAELPFEWVVEGVPLVGVLDRVEELSPGHWRLIDYKVIRKRKSDAELLGLYAPQIEIYAAALRRILKESVEKISASLVQITSEGVFEVPVSVDLSRVSSKVADMASRACQLVEQVGSGKLSRVDVVPAKAGPYCRHCALHDRCDTRKEP